MTIRKLLDMGADMDFLPQMLAPVSKDVTPKLLLPPAPRLTGGRHWGGVSSVLVRDSPPPPPALRAHLVAGSRLLAIHMVAPKAPKFFLFIPLAHFVHLAPQHYP